MDDEYGDVDIDSVLFGGSDPPADGSFDPFLPGLGYSSDEDDGPDGAGDDPEQPDGADGVIRYGRFGSEGNSGFQQNDDQSLPWEGRTGNPPRGIAEQQQREGTDTGIGNVRRIADQRGGSTGTGAFRRERPEGLAGSISDAQQRIRAVATQPLDSHDERGIAVAAQTFHTGSGKPKREYQKQALSSPPQFQSTEFEATLMGLKSNVAGNWILQLVIPPSDAAGVFDLKDAYGLALKVSVVRKRYTDGEG
jgi:hypothetical protein